MANAKDVKDVLDSRREFELEDPNTGEITHYFIAAPSASDVRKADWEYSKVYNQAITDGFLTQSQMVKLLQDKGILDDAYTEELENVRISLAAELFKLENVAEDISEDEREAIAIDVARLRDHLFQLNQRVNGPMGNTCENLAEDARTEFLTSRILQRKDGTKVWEDFEAFQNEENTALCVKARFEVMLWMQGLDSDFLQSTPEQTALRQIAQNRLDKALEQAKAEAAEEDDNSESEKVEEVSLDEVEEKPKKTRGRPKKTEAKKATPKKRGRPKKSE